MSVHAVGTNVATAPRIKGWLERVAAVTPEETRPFLLMMLLSFCLGSSTVFVETAANALFIARFGAGQLPYVYIVSAVTVATFGLGLTRMRSLVPMHRLLGGVTLGMFAITTGIWVGLSLTHLSWLIFAGLVWYRFVKAGVELVFWSVANYIFNIQQAKRLFGPISTGDAIAQIIGYFLIPFLSRGMGTINLFYLAAALFGMGAVVVFAVLKGRKQPAHSPWAGTNGPTQAVASPPPKRYIVLIFGLVAISYFSYYLISFTFYGAAGAQYGQDADGLASFLGIIFGIAAMLSLLAKAFVSSRALQRFGLTPNLMARPLSALLFAVILILIGVNVVPASMVLIFGLTVGLRSLDTVIFNGIYRAASLLLYQPLPINLRLTVLSLSESVIGPLSIGLVGVILLLVDTNNAQMNLFLLVGVCLIWIGMILGLGHMYPQVLRTSLARRLLEGGRLQLDDSTSLAAVRERLDSPYPGEAIYALELLERSGTANLSDAMARLLAHPHPAARREAATRAERLGMVAVLPNLRALMTDADLLVKAAAIRAVAVLGGESVLGEIDRALQEKTGPPAPEILRAALTGLLLNGSPATVALGAAGLTKLMQGGASARKLAAVIVADSRAADQFPLIQPLLQDPSPALRRAVILAVERIPLSLYPPGLLDDLIDLSIDPALGSAVRQALSQGGETVLAQLKIRFAQDPAINRRISMAQTAGRMEIPSAQAWLATLIDSPSGSLRSVVLQALNRQRYVASPEIGTRIQSQIRTEAVEAALVLAALAALDTDTSTLADGLLRLLGDIRQRIFWLLSLIYDRDAMGQIQHNLALSSPEKQAYALELLLVTLRGEVKRLALPLLQPGSPDQMMEALAGQITMPVFTQNEVLRLLAANETEPFTPWLQAAALYIIGRSGLVDMAAAVTPARSSSEPLVAETAGWAADRLQSSGDGSAAVTQSTLESSMLLTIEKALILRTVRLFETTPDEVLVQAASLLEEVNLAAGHAIFHKGDFGDSMYIIVAGKVRVHDGDHLFNYLDEREIFGEMALLDPEPRSATVTAEDDTHLLKLGREALFELIDARPEVAKGIIRGLSQHLRNRIQDIGALQAQLANIVTRPHSS